MTKLRQCSGRPKDTVKLYAIVSAATKLFLEQGYTLTSMDAIAKLADVSKLTIYSHFANKSELFKQVIQQRADLLAAPESFMDYSNQAVEPALVKLGGLFIKLIYHPDSIRLLRIMYSESLHHPEIITLFYEAGPQRIKKAFKDLLFAWVEQKQMAISNLDRATEQFFSLLKGETHIKAMMQIDSQLSETEINEHVQACVDLFLSAYLVKK